MQALRLLLLRVRLRRRRQPAFTLPWQPRCFARTAQQGRLTPCTLHLAGHHRLTLTGGATNHLRPCRTTLEACRTDTTTHRLWPTATHLLP